MNTNRLRPADGETKTYILFHMTKERTTGCLSMLTGELVAYACLPGPLEVV